MKTCQDAAIVCKHCGRDLPKAQNSGESVRPLVRSKAFSGLFAVLAIAIVAGWVLNLITMPDSQRGELVADPSFWYVLIATAIALGVFSDAKRRGNAAVGWSCASFVVAPLALPVYCASRYLNVGERRDGGRAWNVLRNFAIAWTLVMAVVAALSMAQASTGMSVLTSDAARARAGLGLMLGMGLLGAIWFFPVLGALVLGLLVKKNVLEEGPTGPIFWAVVKTDLCDR